jgi:hypothetical protein
MSDPQTPGATTPLFTPPSPEQGSRPKAPILIAAGLVILLVIVLMVTSRGHRAPAAGTILPLAPDAASLALSDLAMSESTSLSGGKSTYIDGHIRNNSSRTVTGVTVQVLFRNDVGLAPQVETLPLLLIRTHEPYVDTEPVSAAPLAPGDEREFRLIFEDINSNWNVNLPEVHITGVATR